MLFSSFSGGHRQSSWQPAADIYRTRAGWLVKLDVAGVRLEDIQTEITGLKCESKDAGATFKLLKAAGTIPWRFRTTVLSVSFRFPCDLKGAEVRVDCCNGILLVELITEGISRE